MCRVLCEILERNKYRTKWWNKIKKASNQIVWKYIRECWEEYRKSTKEICAETSNRYWQIKNWNDKEMD